MMTLVRSRRAFPSCGKGQKYRGRAELFPSRKSATSLLRLMTRATFLTFTRGIKKMAAGVSPLGNGCTLRQIAERVARGTVVRKIRVRRPLESSHRRGKLNANTRRGFQAEKLPERERKGEKRKKKEGTTEGETGRKRMGGRTRERERENARLRNLQRDPGDHARARARRNATRKMPYPRN